MATCVRKVASEVFGVSRGGKREAKDIWWWNDEVQRAIKEKNECFKRAWCFFISSISFPFYFLWIFVLSISFNLFYFLFFFFFFMLL
jgi:hypothetical protein